jgi:4-diphosphocytidyl-2-C-methyl-D-erythritol kinase
MVSGSGPTCIFLARSQDDAVNLAASLSGAGVCRSVRIATGPAITRIISD